PPVPREKPVARMNGFYACLSRGVEDALEVEVAFSGGRGAYRHRLVGVGHERPIAIGLGVHGHRSDSERATGTDDAAGDLAPVGDEDAREQWISRGGPGPPRPPTPPPPAPPPCPPPPRPPARERPPRPWSRSFNRR